MVPIAAFVAPCSTQRRELALLLSPEAFRSLKAMTSSTAPSPESLRWPPGFRGNPLRFVLSSAAGRAVLYVVCLGLVAIPIALFTVLNFVFLPFTADWSARAFRRGAQALGVPVPDRATGVLDFRRIVLMLVQILLALVALIDAALFLTMAAVSVALPFIEPSPQDVRIIGVPTNSLGELIVGCAVLFVIAVVCLVYTSWVIAGVSVSLTALLEADEGQAVADLKRSRAVLADAFTGERRHIERQLHDGTQSYLAALNLNLAAAQLALAKYPETLPPNPQLQAALSDAKANAQHALSSLRTTIRGIYPQVLQDHGLAAALDELASHAGIQCQVRHQFSDGGVIVTKPKEAEPPLAAATALLLYHAAAEGLTNAVKHGGASVATITVTYEQRRGQLEQVQLAVQNAVADSTDQAHIKADTGRRAEPGTGIAGLRERARALGGDAQFTLDGEPGGQTGHEAHRVGTLLVSAPAAV